MITYGTALVVLLVAFAVATLSPIEIVPGSGIEVSNSKS